MFINLRINFNLNLFLIFHQSFSAIIKKLKSSSMFIPKTYHENSWPSMKISPITDLFSEETNSEDLINNDFVHE